MAWDFRAKELRRTNFPLFNEFRIDGHTTDFLLYQVRCILTLSIQLRNYDVVSAQGSFATRDQNLPIAPMVSKSACKSTGLIT